MDIGRVLMTALGFEVVIGGLTFTGSLMAAAKLQELLPGAPDHLPGPERLQLRRCSACMVVLPHRP